VAKAKRRKQRAERLHREPIVRRVGDILATGKPTLFRYESACRHGLRAAWCMKGWKWAVADEQAALVVRLALCRIGASLRPTYRVSGLAEGPGTDYWFCRHCKGRQEPGASSPWCSKECWMADYERQRREQHRRDEEAARAARHAIMGELPPLPAGLRCRHCQKLFQPDRVRDGALRKYCSHACYVAAGAQGRTIPCLVCATPFAAQFINSKYCGAACAAEAERRKRRERAAAVPYAERACAICSTPFTPAGANAQHAVYCSPPCAKEGTRRNVAARRYRRREQAEKAPEPELALAAD
jgi:hypothetical protein